MVWEQHRDDAAAFCQALHPSIYGSLLLYCGSREVAEDLTQETLLRVWRKWGAVSAMDRPDRWALRVAFNLAKSGFRRLRVARRVAALSDGAAAGDSDPTDAITVRSAVAALPPRQRAAVVLRYFNDLSVADTAEILACADGTVKALTSQARATLRIRLDTDPWSHARSSRHGAAFESRAERSPAPIVPDAQEETTHA